MGEGTIPMNPQPTDNSPEMALETPFPAKRYLRFIQPIPIEEAKADRIAELRLLEERISHYKQEFDSLVDFPLPTERTVAKEMLPDDPDYNHPDATFVYDPLSYCGNWEWQNIK